jgi:hypothetical protein
MLKDVVASPINYNTAFHSTLPRLAESIEPAYGFKRPLGPETYEQSIGISHTGSIAAKSANDHRSGSSFQSKSPRIKPEFPLASAKLDPASYEPNYPLMGDKIGAGKHLAAFCSKIERFKTERNSSGEFDDKRDTLWTIEKEQHKFWEPPILAKFTKTSRWSRVPHAQLGCGPDMICYELDNTKQVKKYNTLAECAGCQKIAPYEPDRSRHVPGSPRTKLQQEMRSFHRPPLDFSFLQLQNVEHLRAAAEELVPGFVGGALLSIDGKPASGAWAEDGVQSADASTLGISAPRPPAPPSSLDKDDGQSPVKGRRVAPLTRKRGHKSGATSIRMNNNQLVSISGMSITLASVINYERMSWLDLSNNALVHIELGELSNFPSLIVLNLHCNAITRFSEIGKLNKFKKLRTLTLFSNPVTEKRSYRWRVIAMLPQVKKLDSSVITAKERDRSKHFARRLKKKNTPAKPESKTV